jgi:hypothetical protein
VVVDLLRGGSLQGVWAWSDDETWDWLQARSFRQAEASSLARRVCDELAGKAATCLQRGCITNVTAQTSFFSKSWVNLVF